MGLELTIFSNSKGSTERHGRGAVIIIIIIIINARTRRKTYLLVSY
jgi:hypothetical protein